MNPERTAFLCEDGNIEIIPRVNEPVLHLISGDVGPLEAGMPVSVPLWLAIQLRRRNNCTIVIPSWMCVEELKGLLLRETEDDGLVQLPQSIFQIAHSLVKEAREEIPDCEQIKSLIQDLWDKREAKLRSSSLKFLAQHHQVHARMDHVQASETSSAPLRATLAACKLVSRLVYQSQALDI